MRKKLLKVAIATLAVSLTAGVGLTFVDYKAPTASAAITEDFSDGTLNGWTATGSASLSGGALSMKAGSRLVFDTKVSGDYTLTFDINRPTAGGATVGAYTCSAFVGVNVASSTTAHTSGKWLAFYAGAQGGVFENGSDVNGTSGHVNNWCCQNGTNIISVSGGVATWKHSQHGVAYNAITVPTSGYIVFEAATDITIDNVIFEDGSSGGGVDDGSTNATWPSSPGATTEGQTYVEDFSDTTLERWGVHQEGAGVTYKVDGGALKITNAGDASAFYSLNDYNNFTLEYSVYGIDLGSDPKAWLGVNFACNGNDIFPYRAPLLYVTQEGNAASLNADVTDSNTDVLPYAASNFVTMKLVVNGKNARWSWYNDGATEETGYVTATIATAKAGRVMIPAVVGASFTVDNVYITDQGAPAPITGNDGSIANWTFSSDVVVSEGTAYLNAGSTMYLPVSGNYTFAFSAAGYQANNGGNGFDLFINSTTTAGNTAGDYVKFLADGNANLYLAGQKQAYDANTGAAANPAYNPWHAQEAFAPHMIRVTDGVMTIQGAGNRMYPDVKLTNAEGYIVIKSSSKMTVGGVTYMAGSSGGGGTTDTPGGTQYTNFDDNTIDTSKWHISNGSTMRVSNGKFNFTNTADGDALGSVGTYTNFILQYDVYGLNFNGGVASLGWLGVGFGADSTYNYGKAGNEMVYFTMDTINCHNFTGERPWISNIFEATSYVTIRLEAKDGTVKVGYSIDGGVMQMSVMATNLDTTGHVYIPCVTNSTYQIDNLVLIDSDEYASYQLTKLALPTIQQQHAEGATVTGKIELVDAQGNKANLDGKKVVFQTTEENWVLNADGTYTIVLPEGGTSYTYRYQVLVTDLVLDGWVYPLGSAGEYGLNGKITIGILGSGGDIGGDDGDVSGDTANMPEVIGSASKEIPMGSVESVSFEIDLKGRDITKIKWTRSATEYGFLDIGGSAYTIKKDSVTGFVTITFAAAYMGALPEGTTEFQVSTAKGTAKVSVTTVNYEAPTTTETAVKEVRQYSSANVEFVVDVKGEEVLGVQFIRGSQSGQLEAGSYTIADGKFTLTGAYVSVLPAGTTKFIVNTKGGSVEIPGVNVTAVLAPVVTSAKSVSITETISQAVTFDVDMSGETTFTLVAVRGGVSKVVNASAYTWNGSTLTIKADYVATLPVGTTTFYIQTVAGEDSVTILVEELKGPQVEGNATQSVKQGVAAYFTIQLNNQELRSIEVIRTGVSNTILDADAYSINGKVLTIKGEYTATLPEGATKFKVWTVGGAVELTLNVSKPKAPALSGTTSYTVAQGTEEAKTFTVNLNGEVISEVLVKRAGQADAKLEGVAYTTGANNAFTLKADYVANLPVGTTRFVVKTAGGETAEFSITVTAIVGPQASGTTAYTVKEGTSEAKKFTIDLKGQELIEITVVRGSEKKALSADSYTVNGKEYTLKADYVANLPVGTTTFKFVTKGGSADVTITVTAKVGPAVSGSSTANVDFGDTDANLSFRATMNDATFAGVEITRDGQTKVLNGGYTFANGTLTLDNAYVAMLPVGTTTFTVVTDLGNVTYVVTVSSAAPKINGLNSFSIVEASGAAVQINLVVSGANITAVKQGETILTSDKYSYIAGIFSLTAAYTETLAAGEYTFEIVTDTDASTKSVTFTVTVTAPVVDDDDNTNSEGSSDIWNDNFDVDEWWGDVKPNDTTAFDKGYSADGCSGSVSAIGGLALLGVAAVAMALKKKED